MSPPRDATAAPAVPRGSGALLARGALLAAALLAAGQVALPAEPVTLVFHNLRNYLAMDRRIDGAVVAGAPKPEEEIAALLEGLAPLEPDILAVCEMGDRAFLEDLQARLKARSVDLPHTELLPDAAGHNRNLALLSRFPVEGRHSRSDYTYRIREARLPVQRGVLDVSLDLGDGRSLRCVVLHLKSKREAPVADEALMRLHEARLARRHVEAILAVDPDARLVVVGDFNDLRHEPPVRTLQGAFGRPDYLTALDLADEHGFRWTHHWEHADLYSRLDFALASRRLAREVDRERSYIRHWPSWETASDHRPLVVRFTPAED